MKKNQILLFFLLNTITTFIIVISWDYYKHNNKMVVNNNPIEINNSPHEISDTTIEIKNNISADEKLKVNLILIDGRKIKLSEFPIDEVDVKNSLEAELIDLDNDNVPELVTQYNHGGAHGIENYGIFAKKSDELYEQILSYDDGIEVSQKKIKLKFEVGMFHSRNWRESVGEPFTFFPQIIFKYKSNKFYLDSETDEQLNIQIEKNLTYLKGKGIPPEVDEEDDGTRRAFAVNIVTFYYNNHRNLNATRTFFDKYYLHADEPKIWQDIYNGYLDPFLNDLKKNIKFD